eukprot:GCRY01002237.1.p1 GENE.GCRY01002237.1~~GCRY01002237.1.p1  ORF type:complete len:1051 (-),score=137.54 GCRY01002237.1:462-3614(-)
MLKFVYFVLGFSLFSTLCAEGVFSCSECSENQICVHTSSKTVECICSPNRINFPACNLINPCQESVCGELPNFCHTTGPGTYYCQCARTFFTDSLRQSCNACTVCVPGQRVQTPCALMADAICIDCPDGRFSNSSDALKCEVCDDGWWTPATGAHSQCSDPCPAGYSCAEGVKSPCGPGTYAVAESAACTVCPSGKYQSQSTRPSCEQCPLHSSTVDSNPSNRLASDHDQRTDCQCLRGYTGENGGTCIACSPGYFKQSVGNAACAPCDSGTYSNASAANTCEPCRPGYACHSAGCFPCNQGTYSLTSFSMCMNCGPGNWSNSTASTCGLCSIGYACPGNGSMVPCGPGTYSGWGFQFCKVCIDNTYSLGSTNTACTSCPNNSTTSGDLAVNHDSKEDCACLPGYKLLKEDYRCEICPEGTFARDANSLECKFCAPGNWSAAGSSQCTQCPAGYKCSKGVKAGCLPGYFAAEGSSECSMCSDGQFSEEYAGVCEDCGLGTYGTSEHTSCEPCAAGTFSNATRVTVCAGCESGKWSEPEATSCTPCDSGSYRNATMEGCQYCPPGSTSLGGCSSCDTCLAGYWADPKEGILWCDFCPAGYRCNDQKKIACTLVGQYSEERASVCSTCSESRTTVGSEITSHDSASDCVCPAGSYGDESTCTLCGEGEYQPAANQSSCISCPNGYWASADGATSCDTCPSGHKCKAGTKTACDPGTYALAGSSICTICGNDFYNALSGQSNCTQCPEGRHITSISVSDHLSINNCSCPEGSVPVDSSCKPCSAGYYCVNSVMTQCDVGYWSMAEQSVCTACNPGEQDGNAHKECAVCPTDTYNPNEGSACVACPTGAVTKESSNPSDHDNIDDCLCRPKSFLSTKQKKCINGSRVFVTKKPYEGNFAANPVSLQGFCMKAAEDAGLPPELQFVVVYYTGCNLAVDLSSVADDLYSMNDELVAKKDLLTADYPGASDGWLAPISWASGDISKEDPLFWTGRSFLTNTISCGTGEDSFVENYCFSFAPLGNMKEQGQKALYYEADSCNEAHALLCIEVGDKRNS